MKHNRTELEERYDALLKPGDKVSVSATLEQLKEWGIPYALDKRLGIVNHLDGPVSCVNFPGVSACFIIPNQYLTKQNG